MKTLTLNNLCDKCEDSSIKIIFKSIEAKLKNSGIGEYILNNYDGIRAEDKFQNIALEFYKVLLANNSDNKNLKFPISKNGLINFDEYDDWFCNKLLDLYKLNNDKNYHLISDKIDHNDPIDDMVDYMMDYLNRYNITKKFVEKYHSDEAMIKFEISMLIQKFICYIYHKKYGREYDENKIQFFDEHRPFNQLDIDTYAKEFLTKEYEKI